MNKFRPHIVIVFLLLLLAGPWLQTSEARVSTNETAASCCQGEGHSCCCCALSGSDDTKTSNDSDRCGCEISALPVLPSLPMEINEHRSLDRSKEALADVHISDQPNSKNDFEIFIPDKSPPSVHSQPAYLLFSTLLI